LFEHLGNAAEAKSLYPSFMQRIVANFEQRGNGRAPTSTPRSSRCAASVPPRSLRQAFP
jgi:hypothetical protein